MIYFIQSGKNGPIKIGHTMGNDLRRRFWGLQTANPEELYCLGIIDGEHGDRALEQDILLRFKRYRIRGEWFRPNDELSEFIETYALVCNQRLKAIT